MPIDFTCPACANESQVRDDLAGKRVRCKKCGNVSVVAGAAKLERPARRRKLIILGSIGTATLLLAALVTTFLVRRSMAEASYEKGILCARDGDWKNAESHFSDAIRYNSSHKKAYVKRADINHVLRRPNNALADCAEAIRIDPNFADAYHIQSEVYAGTGQAGLAVVSITKAMDLDERFRGAKTYAFRASQQAGMGKLNEAVNDASLAINKDPECLRAYKVRGMVYWKLGDINKARLDLEKASFEASLELDLLKLGGQFPGFPFGMW